MDLPILTLVIAVLLVVVGLLQPLATLLRLPHSIVLAGVGVALAVAASLLSSQAAGTAIGRAAGSLLEIPVTSSAFLFVFLPILLFQAALTMEVRRLLEDSATILLLAVVAVILTTFAVGLALWPIAGLSIVVCLLLGSIIATTDPAAVVAIFREIGAPARLTRLLEGESVLNDAAAIALFTVLLQILQLDQAPSLVAGTVSFLVSFAGGLLVGLAGTRVFIAAMPLLREYPLAQTTLMLALPYLLFIPAQQHLNVSGVVAVVTSGLMISAYGPARFSPATWRFLNSIWDQLAFWASSLVFILASLLVPKLLGGVTLHDIFLVLVVVAASIAARAVVLYGLLPLLTATKLAQPISQRFRAVILWGGLRGAVTLALALSITENALLPTEVQRFVAICATGFVLFTLFINGTTLRPLIRLLHLDRLSQRDRALRENVLALAWTSARDSLTDAAARFGIADPIAADAAAPYEERLQRLSESLSKEPDIADRDRIAIGLVAVAHKERELVMDHFHRRAVSPRIAQTLIENVDSMIDRARLGRSEYNRAARRRLDFGWSFRVAGVLHHRLGRPQYIARLLADRFEILVLTGFILREVREFVGQRLEQLFGARVAEILAEIVDSRIEGTDKALEVLHLQYPEYTAGIQRRFLERFALRVEELEYDGMIAEGLVGPEIFKTLRSAVEKARTHAERRPQLDVGVNAADLIRSFPRFRDLDKAQIAEVAALLKPRFVVPGERIISAGERGDAMYFIASGAVEVALESRRFRLGRGDFFGEMALLSGRRRRADVTALAFGQLLALSDDDFLRLTETEPGWRRIVREVTAERERINRAEVAAPEHPPRPPDAA